MSARSSRAVLFFAFAVAVTLSACADRTPFVYRQSEFDREQPGFGQAVSARTDVVICYARSATTPDAVRALAEEACGQVGKRAVFSKHIPSVCPLATPASAAFDCVAP